MAKLTITDLINKYKNHKKDLQYRFETADALGFEGEMFKIRLEIKMNNTIINDLLDTLK